MAAVGYGVVNAGTYTTDKFVGGSDQAADGIVINTNKFTVAADSGNTLIAGTLTVTGLTTLNGGITADSGAFAVANTSGNITTTGTLAVTGAASCAALTSAAITATGNSTIDGTFGTGTSGTTFTVAADGALAIATDKFTVSAAGVVSAASTVTSIGNFTVGVSKVVVTAATGAIAIASTGSIAVDTNKFTVSGAGAVLIASTLTVTGAATFNGGIGMAVVVARETETRGADAQAAPTGGIRGMVKRDGGSCGLRRFQYAAQQQAAQQPRQYFRDHAVASSQSMITGERSRAPSNTMFSSASRTRPSAIQWIT